MVRIVKLERERLPATGRGALDDSTIGLWDQPERGLEVWHQLLGDRIAPGPVVRRIQRVGLEEVRPRAHQRDPDHAGEAIAHPFLRELIAGLGIGVGRPGARPLGIAGRIRVEGERATKMAECINGGIACVRVVGEPLRQQYFGADGNGKSPELGQDLALDPHLFDPRRIGGRRGRRDCFGELQRQR